MAHNYPTILEIEALGILHLCNLKYSAQSVSLLVISQKYNVLQSHN